MSLNTIGKLDQFKNYKKVATNIMLDDKEKTIVIYDPSKGSYHTIIIGSAYLIVGNHENEKELLKYFES